MQYVPTRVTRGAIVAHRHSLAPFRCRTAELLYPSHVPLGNDLHDPVFDGVGLAAFQSSANAALRDQICSFFSFPTIFTFSSFHGLVVWSGGLRIDRVFSLLPALHCSSFK